MDSVTIKDIAEAINISYSTVSRALNDKYGVKPETRRKVLEAARSLGYQPNAVAQGLVTRRTSSIGLILPDITNPFYPEVAAGVERAADEQGLSVLLCNTNWMEHKQRRYLELFAQRRVDGLIVSPISDEIEADVSLALRNLPIVYVSNAPRKASRPFVIIDDRAGAREATRHLLAQGYESVGFIGAQTGSVSVSDRLEGYREALREYGHDYGDRYMYLSDFRQMTGYEVIRRLIREKAAPRAVFAENDFIALGVLQGARELGLSVPEELAIVGFDDVPMAGFGDIGLSTVRQPKRDMGYESVKLLLAEMQRQPAAPECEGSQGPDSGEASDSEAPESEAEEPCRQIIVEPELVVRRTSVRSPTRSG